MGSDLSRRDFLAGAASAAAAATLAPALARAAGKSGPFLAVRDAHLKFVDPADCWKALQAIGAEGVEAGLDDKLGLPNLVCGDRKYSVADAAGIDALRKDLQKAGKRITAFCMFNHFDERPDFEIECCAKAAQAAKALGAAAIRIDVVPRKTKPEQFLDVAVDILKKVMPGVEKAGVPLAIENHGRYTNNPDFIQPLFDRVGSKCLGLTLDTGNFYWFGHPLTKLYALYEKFAPRVFHTHCKSIHYDADQREVQRPVGLEYGKRCCPIYEGDIDFARVVKILRAAGYANDFCIEDESLGRFPEDQRAGILKKEIDHLRKLL